MASRPTVGIRSSTGGVCINDAEKYHGFTLSSEASGSLPLPAVLTAPIRLDVVQQVHSTHILDQGPMDVVFTMDCREHRQKQETGIRS